MKQIPLKKRIAISALILVGLCVTLLATGCDARAKYMTPECYEVAKQMPYTVSVNESKGGIDPKPLWTSQISNTEFTAALMSALEQSGVFQEVTTGDNADYILEVKILDYDQPWNSADMKVRMETKWKLIDTKTRKVIWSNTFPSAYRAVWASSLTDTGRIKKAHEGAARANIKEGIRRLSALDI